MTRWRTLLWLLVPVVICGAIWVGLAGECGAGGGCIATVQVEGRQYVASVARSTTISEADLSTYAPATRNRTGFRTTGDQAYRLGSIDPAKVLVMRFEPGQTDGAGAVGSYLLLIGDPSGWMLTCPYYADDNPLRPSDCESLAPTTP